MKFLTSSILLLNLFYFHFDGVQCGLRILTQPSLENNESAQVNATTTTTAPEQESLETVSIQDLLLSGIDGNEKIEKKIINEIKQFPKNFQHYRKPIILTTEGYFFPKKLIKYNTDKGYVVVFRNASVSQWYEYTSDTFSYSVGCDSPTKATIRVGLPKNIKIVANISITHPLIETIQEGVITIVIKNGSILKEINATNRTATNLEESFFQISFTNSNIDVEFAGPQTLIYNKVEAFLDEVISSLRELFAQQLNEQMEERGLNVLSDCSKIRYAELYLKKVNLPHFNNFLNNLYVIPEVRVETWKGITVSAGPIVIDGFSFNSTEFSVYKEYYPNYGYSKQLISRLKTGSLKGKFNWNYSVGNENENNSTSVFLFSIDNILFENVFSCNPSNRRRWNQDMNVYLGKTTLKPSKSNSDIIEIKFANFVLSEYLKSAVAESLRKSLSEKSDDSQTSFVDNFF